MSAAHTLEHVTQMNHHRIPTSLYCNKAAESIFRHATRPEPAMLDSMFVELLAVAAGLAPLCSPLAVPLPKRALDSEDAAPDSASASR